MGQMPRLKLGGIWWGEDLLKGAEFGETAAAPHIQGVTRMLEQGTGSLSPTINLTLLVANLLFLICFCELKSV